MTLKPTGFDQNESDQNEFNKNEVDKSRGSSTRMRLSGIGEFDRNKVIKSKGVLSEQSVHQYPPTLADEHNHAH